MSTSLPLAVGVSVISGLGSTRVLLYRYSAGYINYSLIFQDVFGNNLEIPLTNTDLFIRVQRNGATKSLKAWNVDAAGTLTPITNGEVSSPWYSGATLSPGFSLGAATTQDTMSNGWIWPFNGQLAFYRFFNANADNATTPDQCDSASALIRYEFENNLTNSGTASVALTPTGNPAYQSTPATSRSRRHPSPPAAPPLTPLVSIVRTSPAR